MTNMMLAPSKYIQGTHLLEDVGRYVKKFGTKPLVLISGSGKKRFGETMVASMAKEGIHPVFAIFCGECTKAEVQRVVALAKEAGCQSIIGMGGGKILDAAKAIGHFCQMPVVSFPTLASTDAPCSSAVVLYTEAGSVDDYMFLDKNPDLVLVDVSIIVKSPVRLTVAGMGDALTTYFEARACYASQGAAIAGGTPTLAAFALAKLCYETLLADGYAAKKALERGVCTKSVENIIEANTLLSGLGFESGGVAAAHAIHDGFALTPACHGSYHGEKVAFGILIQLILEHAPMEEFQQVQNFCKSVGLPVTLAQLGMTDYTDADIWRIAQVAVEPSSMMKNMHVAVTAQDVYAAILTADALGQ